MEVRRLKGETQFGTYVVSIFIGKGRIEKIEICGRGAHRSVVETCGWLSGIKTTMTEEAVKAVKLDMMKHNEYRGESCTTGPTRT